MEITSSVYYFIRETKLTDTTTIKININANRYAYEKLPHAIWPNVVKVN